MGPPPFDDINDIFVDAEVRPCSNNSQDHLLYPPPQRAASTSLQFRGTPSRLPKDGNGNGNVTKSIVTEQLKAEDGIDGCRYLVKEGPRVPSPDFSDHNASALGGSSIYGVERVSLKVSLLSCSMSSEKSITDFYNLDSEPQYGLPKVG